MALAAVSGAAAQTSVTTYGLLDLSVGAKRTGSGTTLPSGTQGTANERTTVLDPNVALGSRLGFRGTEDLGGGMKANYLMEMGLAADTGTITQGGLGFGRQVYVGLSSNQWALAMGRQYSLMNVAIATSEAFAGGYWGNVAGPATGTAESVGSTPGNGSYQLNTRVDNAVLLAVSNGPFLGNVMVAAGNENARGTGRSVQASVAYQEGPVRATAAYARLRQNAEQITATAQPEWLTQWTVGATYDLKVVKLYGGYFSGDGGKNKANFSTVATVGAVGASPFAYLWTAHKIGWLGARVPMGLHSVAVSLAREVQSYDAGASGKATTLGLVYEYTLSKRTTLYSSYGQVSNDGRARAALYGAIPAVLASGYGANPRAVSAGVYHRF